MHRNASVRRLFLVDGIGALTSAVMLGLVLTTLEPVFGMPSRVLVPLAIVAGLFAVYSLACHRMNLGPAFLQGIAVANSVYCGVTLALVVAYRDSLTWLGIAYFAGEILVILGLVAAEFNAARGASRPLPGDRANPMTRTRSWQREDR
jgi:FtsH-binding integral membrane protein